MRKGVFGKTLTILISLVLAVLSLILIWYYHERLFGYLGGTLLEGLKGFVCSLVSIFGRRLC